MRKVITPATRSNSVRTQRNARTHGSLRKFVFRQVLAGKCLRESNMVLCFEVSEMVSVRAAVAGTPTRTQELTRFRDSRWDRGASQPAEYSARTREDAEAQFLADFPKLGGSRTVVMG